MAEDDYNNSTSDALPLAEMSSPPAMPGSLIHFVTK